MFKIGSMLIAILAISVSFSNSKLIAADLTAEQEKTAKNIETKIVAACCFRQPVSQHDSGKSTEAKIQIRKLLSEGRSEEEIIETFVEQYGEIILSAPRKEGLGLLAYLLPMIGIIVAIGVVSLRGIMSPKSKPDLPEKPTTDYDTKLDEELKNF